MYRREESLLTQASVRSNFFCPLGKESSLFISHMAWPSPILTRDQKTLRKPLMNMSILEKYYISTVQWKLLWTRLIFKNNPKNSKWSSQKKSDVLLLTYCLQLLSVFFPVRPPQHSCETKLPAHNQCYESTPNRMSSTLNTASVKDHENCGACSHRLFSHCDAYDTCVKGHSKKNKHI